MPEKDASNPKNPPKIAKWPKLPDFFIFSKALSFEPVHRFSIVIPVFHTEFKYLQILFCDVPKIPLDGVFGYFHKLFWRFS